jgi:predicted nucleic acid-binding protein
MSDVKLISAGLSSGAPMTNSGQFLLDTNVVSEIHKARPDTQVVDFVNSLPRRSILISILSIAELRKGAANARVNSQLRNDLNRWIDSLEMVEFVDRVLGVNGPTARIWGELSAQRTRPVIDTFLAATAIVHNLTLVTRNERDFADIPVKLLNPWKP